MWLRIPRNVHYDGKIWWSQIDIFRQALQTERRSLWEVIGILNK